MNRIKKIIRNILIIVVLSYFIMIQLDLYLTPLSAYENSERRLNYGPSKVVHIDNFWKGKYILGKYDKWISCDTVNKVWFFFWSPGDQNIGFENVKTLAVSHAFRATRQSLIVYGIVNDNRIKKLEITLDSGDILTEKDFYQNLFAITWKVQDSKLVFIKTIKGYDSEGNIVYEEEL